MNRALLCPSCRAPLTQSNTLDIFAVGFNCAGEHRFFSYTYERAMTVVQPEDVQIPHDRSADQEIIEFWLTNPEARGALNSQLAEMLRRVHSLLGSGERVDAAATFDHCPLCGGRLEEYEQPDIWVRGLRCASGHDWALRGLRIWTRVDGEQLLLSAEMPESTLKSHLTAWLGDTPGLRETLHPSIAIVFENFRRSMGN